MPPDKHTLSANASPCPNQDVLNYRLDKAIVEDGVNQVSTVSDGGLIPLRPLAEGIPLEALNNSSLNAAIAGDQAATAEIR
ncbi:MAG: hypothetical protein AAGE59_02370 [Cyanobacteria bacterium P01_F01_bin.86]